AGTIVALDADGVAALLRATGPLTVDGVVVEARTYAAFSSVELYRRYPDSRARQLFEERLIDVMMDALLSSGDLQELARGLAESAAEKHLLLWSSEPEVQSVFVDLSVAGRVREAEGEASFGIFGNSIDEAWSKLFPFTHRTYTYRARVAGRAVRGDLGVTIENRAPSGLPPYVLGPVQDARFRSEVFPVGVGGSARRIDVARGGSTQLGYRVNSPIEPGRLVLRFFKQPSPNPDTLRIDIDLPEGARIRSVSGGWRLEGNRLTFRGTTSSDMVFEAVYAT
ncbi:MAG TPA: hypothetical protein VM600_05615, partial [Actinomycetota bacterium]|nr:hypothetical protein [Actinomycetota bacterium]